MTIFVVEDSSLLRERLIRTLNTLKQVKVSGFSDTAEDAIQQIREQKPDAVILDIRLRVGNGFQVLQACKIAGKPPLVIVLTNFAYPQYRKKYMEAGADFFLDKSNEFDQVVVVLNQYLDKTRAENQQLDA